MRVCLAAEVLSHTVAAGISTYVALGKLPDEAIHTAEFVEAVDGLFDCFNSRNTCLILLELYCHIMVYTV